MRRFIHNLRLQTPSNNCQEAEDVVITQLLHAVTATDTVSCDKIENLTISAVQSLAQNKVDSHLLKINLDDKLTLVRLPFRRDKLVLPVKKLRAIFKKKQTASG